MTQSSAPAPAAEQSLVAQRTSSIALARLRDLALLPALVVLLIIGVYNLMHRPVQTKEFHILFGIKMLLALHVFAVSVIATRADNPRRSRQLTGIVISGVVILIISAAFRWV